MIGLSGVFISILIGVVIAIGKIARVDVHSTFVSGVGKGIRSAVRLMPTLAAMLIMLSMMNAAGLTAAITKLLMPILTTLHIPEEVTPLIIFRPLSGSGSLAALEQILQQSGPDSRAGMMASVLMGSSETIFYTMTVYMGGADVKRLPRVMPIAIMAYLAGVVICAMIM